MADEPLTDAQLNDMRTRAYSNKFSIVPEYDDELDVTIARSPEYEAVQADVLALLEEVVRLRELVTTTFEDGVALFTDKGGSLFGKARTQIQQLRYKVKMLEASQEQPKRDAKRFQEEAAKIGYELAHTRDALSISLLERGRTEEELLHMKAENAALQTELKELRKAAGILSPSEEL